MRLTMKTYRHINVEQRDGVCCVRLRHSRLEEAEIQQLGEELVSLCTEDGYSRIALSLGPEAPDCLYSVFLAKLVGVRNMLAKSNGRLVLCEVTTVAFNVFESCQLHREFVFLEDFAAAIAYFAESA
jgi:hypothetical protein